VFAISTDGSTRLSPGKLEIKTQKSIKYYNPAMPLRRHGVGQKGMRISAWLFSANAKRKTCALHSLPETLSQMGIAWINPP
jgi:hypothetical protein